MTWPGRVERLALLCTSPGGEGGASYPLQDLDALDPGARAQVAAELLDTRFTPDWLASHPGDQALADIVTQRTATRGGGTDAPTPNSEAIVARIPDAELRSYEGGHAFMVQDSSAYPEILEFLTA